MSNLLLTPISKALNTYLNLDPESKLRLRELYGKAITIELLPFHFVFQCQFDEEGVKVQPDETIMTDTKITGTPLQMLGVMVSKDNRQHFFAEDVTITGNAELGQQVIALFDELYIDWEDYLSRFIGDVPAYHFGKLVRNIKEKVISAESKMSENINEYIHEEINWFPSREALIDLFNDIDTFRMDVDRIEAKIKEIQSIYFNKETP